MLPLLLTPPLLGTAPISDESTRHARPGRSTMGPWIRAAQPSNSVFQSLSLSVLPFLACIPHIRIRIRIRTRGRLSRLQPPVSSCARVRTDDGQCPGRQGDGLEHEPPDGPYSYDPSSHSRPLGAVPLSLSSVPHSLAFWPFSFSGAWSPLALL